MDNIQFKDVAGFYLGCECKRAVKVPYQELNFETQVFNIRLLYELQTNLSLIKPILRPLSDMTQEECDEYNDIKATVFSLNKLRDKISTEARCAYYLLSKHFDLFNLIESNQAIQKQ